MDQVEEVKSKVDLVEIVSSYIPLKKSGRNFAGLCPFHGEKTPSFFVSPERQAFKCFGCGEAGDVFTFLEKIEGWEFREALEELAKRVGVKLKSFVPTEKTKTREKLLEIHKLVSRFYNHLLLNHPVGEKARKYLEGRGIKKPIWENFNLGYAPNAWENTFDFLTKHGFDIADIATSGLVIARERSRDNSFYDRFRDRLVFPLKDSRGEVVGFSGRIIEGGSSVKGLASREGPKYLNSPQTPIFEKGAILFGFYEVRNAIKEKNEAVLVEGEFDMLSAFQAGVGNVVASKGTALTEKQVALLARTCENVFLCFDTDLAGDAAARRGIELLDLAGVTVKVVGLGNYKDPDEFVRKDAGGFKKAIGESSNIYDYFIDSAVRRFDPKTVEGKKKIGREITPMLSKISDEMVRAHYTAKLANVLDLDINMVAAAIEKKVENVFIDETKFEKQGEVQAASGATNLEEYFLALFIWQDEILTSNNWDLTEGDFSDLACCDFWKATSAIIKASKKAKKTLSAKHLIKRLSEKFSAFVDNLYLVNVSPDFAEKELWGEEIAKVARRIKVASLKRQLEEISSKIKTAEVSLRANEVKKLTEEFDKCAKYLEEYKLEQ